MMIYWEHNKAETEVEGQKNEKQRKRDGGKRRGRD